jgi:hypothetical protein
MKLCNSYFATNTVNTFYVLLFFFGGGGGNDAKDSKLRHERRIMLREYFQPFSSQPFVFPSAGNKPEDQNKEKL